MWTPNKEDIITAEQREAEAIETAWKDFRSERDRLLAETDWVILRNLETSEPVPQKWLDYRQSLRDLTNTIEDPTKPVWPSKPQN